MGLFCYFQSDLGEYQRDSYGHFSPKNLHSTRGGWVLMNIRSWPGLGRWRLLPGVVGVGWVSPWLWNLLSPRTGPSHPRSQDTLSLSTEVLAALSCLPNDQLVPFPDVLSLSLTRSCGLARVTRAQLTGPWGWVKSCLDFHVVQLPCSTWEPSSWNPGNTSFLHPREGVWVSRDPLALLGGRAGSGSGALSPSTQDRTLLLWSVQAATSPNPVFC